MRKLSFLIALCTLLTVGGVYATWTYMETTNVADETIHMSVNLGNVEFAGSYGQYIVDASGVTMTIDPKTGIESKHTTALYINGDLVIKFIPNINAPEDVKNYGVASTYQFKLSTGSTWTYEGEDILTIPHAEAHSIALANSAEEDRWVKQDDGSFTFTISASELAAHFQLTEFVLDTKAKYDIYNAALGQIDVTVSDGQ